jgi:hypothetical protein
VQRKNLSIAGIVIVAGGVVMLIASLLPFYEFASLHHTAWSSDLLFPVTIIPVLLGVTMAAQVAVSHFLPQVKLPARPLGFTWNQVHLAFGAQATVMMLALLVQKRGLLSPGSGFWLMLLASIALVVGAVLRTREPAATT